MQRRKEITLTNYYWFLIVLIDQFDKHNTHCIMVVTLDIQMHGKYTQYMDMERTESNITREKERKEKQDGMNLRQI